MVALVNMLSDTCDYEDQMLDSHQQPMRMIYRCNHTRNGNEVFYDFFPSLKASRGWLFVSEYVFC